MADSQVQDVKDRIDIVELVQQYLPLKRSGTNYKGLCPFHNERSPSFMVHPERQSFKCFGCSEGGDAITFLQKMEGLTFPEALQLLADRVGIQLTKQTVASQQEKDEKSQLYRLNAAVAAFFHHALTVSPAGKPAQEYLVRRKLTQATIEAFQLGFAPAQSQLAAWLAKQGFQPAELNRAGHPERFRNRIMFPIRDALGHVVGFTGRLIEDNQDGPKYLNTPETPIFQKSKVVYGLYEGKDAIRRYQAAILMEGQMDVILSHQVGVRVAIASSGTALTADHVRAIRRYTPKVLLAFDADVAGQAATEKALLLTAAAELATKVIPMPAGMKDAGETIEHDPALWQQAIGQATPGIEWLIGSMTAKFGIADGASKKMVARSVVPHIRAIGDSVERAHAVAALARALSVPEQAIADALEKVAAPRTAAQQLTGATPTAPPATRPIVERLVGVLLLHPSLLATVGLDGVVPAGSLSERLVTTMLTCYTPDDRQTTANFLTSVQSALGREDQAQLASLLMETEHWLTPELVPSEVAQELLIRLRQGEREDIKRSMAAKIAAAEASGNREHVKQLMNELQSVLQPPSTHAKT